MQNFVLNPVQKKRGSEADAPDQRPGARRLMETVKDHLVFNKGHITPKISAKALRPFEDRIRIFEPGKLCENIREDLGYTVESLEQGKHPEREAQKYRFVEKTMQIALDSYDGAVRENGYPSVTHPLMTGALGAATGEPTRTVMLDIFHDVTEDTLDPRHPEIKFRAMMGGKLAEYGDDRKIFVFARKNFGRYGKGLARDMRVMTRYEKEREGKSWERVYMEYLVSIHQYIDPMLVKGNDNLVNLLDLPFIQDRGARLGKARKLVLKAFWNAQRLKRVSWIKAEFLRAGIGKAPGGKLYADFLNDVTRQEIGKFGRGWAYSPVRQYDSKLFRSVNLSGSPALDLYLGSDTQRGRYEMEFPFVQSEDMAKAILKYAFGSRVEDIANTQSILPRRLTNARILSFFTSTRDLEACMVRAVKVYDDMLASGILLPQLEGFNRKEWADAARGRMERIKSERR